MAKDWATFTSHIIAKGLFFYLAFCKADAKPLEFLSISQIQLQYAKAKEAEGHYRDAVVAYEAARDYDNAVRIHLVSGKHTFKIFYGAQGKN